MNYSRAAFRAWLTTLPDEPGAGWPTKCPINAFLKCCDHAAVRVDRQLVRAIDRISHDQSRVWRSLIPSEIIALIDSLDSEKKEEKHTPKEALGDWELCPYKPKGWLAA